jgi:hypothetical protein
MVQIGIAASNGAFSGATKLYLALHSPELKVLAARLSGFPTSIDQVINFDLGITDQEQPAVRLKFYCRDRAGHTAVDIAIRRSVFDDPKPKYPPENASFTLYFVPAGLDRFVDELIALIQEDDGAAILPVSGSEKWWFGG